MLPGPPRSPGEEFQQALLVLGPQLGGRGWGNTRMHLPPRGRGPGLTEASRVGLRGLVSGVRCGVLV